MLPGEAGSSMTLLGLVAATRLGPVTSERPVSPSFSHSDPNTSSMAAVEDRRSDVSASLAASNDRIDVARSTLGVRSA